MRLRTAMPWKWRMCFTLMPPTPPSPLLCVNSCHFAGDSRRSGTKQHTFRHHRVSLPLLEACWGPEHALSRYELGENSSSGLVSMIWWEVLLSSNGIWQLTGGGLWELGSWADGRRLDEDVGGMGRPGKEDRGVKGQQWVSWEHPKKVTLKPAHNIYVYIFKWSAPDELFNGFDGSSTAQMHTTCSMILDPLLI